MKFTATSDDKTQSAAENDRIPLKGNTPTDVQESLFHVALIEPEIPQNTGNIGRTCVGLRADLHLVGPLGFSITDRNLKRAGLDYWQHLSWKMHDSLEEWAQLVENPRRVFYFSAMADKLFYEQKFEKGDWFVFGKETAGLPEEILQRNKDRCLLIPIQGPVRGYNVATAVAMVLSEAYRQQQPSRPATEIKG